MALLPDGRSLVFSGVRGNQQQLFLRALDQLEAVPIAGTEDAASPFLSPDAKWVGFWTNRTLKKVALNGGGPPTAICETGQAGSFFFGANWGRNDGIVFAGGIGGLWQVAASGGTPKALTKLDANAGEVGHRLPQFLPDGRTVIFTVTHSVLPRWEDARLAAVSLATGERKDLGPGADARYLLTGHLAYLRVGTLVVAPFDLNRLEITGGPVSLIADVMQAANMNGSALDTGAGQFSVSASGTLVYVPGGISPDPERSIVWVDRRGMAQPIPLQRRPYIGPQLSPDGRQLLLWTQGTDRNVWVYDFARSTLTRVTTEGRNSRAIWTRDGQRITFAGATSGVDNLFWKPADGSGPAERLTRSANMEFTGSWSPDGQLTYLETLPGRTDIWILPVAGDRRPHPIVQNQYVKWNPEFSPDGRWLAYESNETGRNEVYVQPFPGPGKRVQVTNDGGMHPAWAQTGHELFYVTLRPNGTTPVDIQTTFDIYIRLMAVPVTTMPTFTAGVPRMLFEGPYGGSTRTRNYDVTADGQKFVMVQAYPRPPLKPTQVILVQNWFEEVRRRVPMK
jgi:serine/threonine-protein kinase